jgi:hypothetical protein
MDQLMITGFTINGRLIRLSSFIVSCTVYKNEVMETEEIRIVSSLTSPEFLQVTSEWSIPALQRPKTPV